MIEVVFSVCLLAEPSRCHEERLSFMAESVTPQQCMMYGQSEMAKWMEGHPGFSVQKWGCGRARTLAKA
jgi:hypothetical protein